eukprot:CAMPEP_0119037218 /NCGR_PEP_ID=MMETSP1177-20130426/5425_1 /TAXON_ID=2985 /ORGANISM="Ochromonas sp, Strain CCMP1899" /LENGTH=232 /DNA_ID=CAMNT_0006998155 /DNA_START=51 /DNA_END=749 /DNA_ORIENTATION=-
MNESEPLPAIADEDEKIDSFERYFPPKVSALVGLGALPNDLSYLGEEAKISMKGNAKAVELLDMDGNHLAQFRSGSEASKAVNVLQGDISLCCRGMRDSMGGYKFRFVAEDIRPEAKLKRGFAYEVYDETNQPIEARTTRASRFGPVVGEIPFPIIPKLGLLAPPELKVRKWRKVLVKLGSLIIPKWVSDQAQPTVELQDLVPKKEKVGRKRKSILVGRGSTAHEILGEYED